jgi:DNA-binding PadR family transcriptional regulator
MDIAQCACSGKNLDRLLRPTILGMLAREKTHGYDLVQRLNELKMFSDIPPDISGVYKVLKLMEEERLIAANLEFGESRPAKRSYSLTKDGMACLKKWAETLENYRAQIDGLLNILDLKKKLPTSSRAKGCQNRKKCCG